jgi:hypothetical protein
VPVAANAAVETNNVKSMDIKYRMIRFSFIDHFIPARFDDADSLHLHAFPAAWLIELKSNTKIALRP